MNPPCFYPAHRNLQCTHRTCCIFSHNDDSIRLQGKPEKRCLLKAALPSHRFLTSRQVQRIDRTRPLLHRHSSRWRQFGAQAPRFSIVMGLDLHWTSWRRRQRSPSGQRCLATEECLTTAYRAPLQTPVLRADLTISSRQPSFRLSLTPGYGPADANAIAGRHGLHTDGHGRGSGTRHGADSRREERAPHDCHVTSPWTHGERAHRHSPAQF